MVTYGFFDSINGDRRYNADQMSEYFKGLIGDGIYESIGDAFVVEAGSGMNVTVGSGRAVIDCKWLDNDSDASVEISVADLSHPRYTSVVLRLNYETRSMEIGTIDGTPAASPEKPERTWDDSIKELVVADVYVPAGATQVSDAYIEDTRSLEECGWVTGLITQLDISNLYRQWVALFNDYFEGIQEEYEAWFDMLTEDLNVSTYIRKFDKRVVLASGEDNNHIALDMANYSYSNNDVINVYINGLYGSQGIDWTLDTTDTPAEIITTATAVGTEVCIEVLKSKVGFNALIGADNDPVVDQNDRNILLGGD